MTTATARRFLHDLADSIGLVVIAALLAVALAFGIGFGPGTFVNLGQSPHEAPDTQATTWHGAPGNTPGYGGNSANPDGEGVDGGNGIHGIANNPGQSGNSPGGEAPACDMHNGFNGRKSQCP